MGESYRAGNGWYGDIHHTETRGRLACINPGKQLPDMGSEKDKLARLQDRSQPTPYQQHSWSRRRSLLRTLRSRMPSLCRHIPAATGWTAFIPPITQKPIGAVDHTAGSILLTGNRPRGRWKMQENPAESMQIWVK